MKEIVTSSGHVILVDDADFEYLNQFKWYIGGKEYASRMTKTRSGRRQTILMHRVILGLEFGDPRFGDHKNRVRTDNRRENLRICNRVQNRANRTDCGPSGFKGVSWDKYRNRWKARIFSSGKRVGLGLFRTPEEAAEVYNLAALMIHGEFAA